MLKKRIALRDHSAESALFIRRVLFCLFFVIVLLSILFANLYYLQVKQYKQYSTRSNDNRINVLPIAPPRGLIYDRNGYLLAENRPSFDLQLIPEDVKHIHDTVDKLTQLLNIPEDEVEQFYKDLKHTRRFKPVILMSELNDQQVAKFSVNQFQFPGVSIESHLTRYYPYGEALTHVVGYVSRINTNDLQRLDAEGQLSNYTATRNIGKRGIERYYEQLLHGKAGYQEVEVNNRGRIIRTLKVVPPVPGKDLYLNIDINLQLQAMSLLKGKRGAIILLNAKDSGVLVMASSPSYDPNAFVNGISSKEYSQLLQSQNRPLINRATQGTYPPGSTVKPLLAIMGLEKGKITPTQKIFDPGWFQIPNTKRKFRDWKRWGHGWVNVHKAIKESVDTYFYWLAFNTGIDTIHNYMSKFGFGQYTGIDIHEESKGNMPSRQWKHMRYHQPWWQGDTISVGIGQGYWTTTPLQLGEAINILANDGKIVTPRLLNSIAANGQKIEVPPDLRKPITLNNPKNWQIAQDGMYAVVNDLHGTAHRAFLGANYVAAGKTGTAQLVSRADGEAVRKDLAERHRDNGMFVGYAPFKHPQIIASVALENAGGSFPAIMFARRLFDSYFAHNPELISHE
ncbi:penicillin-binding protein 2 [Celerinatantimonas sp. MCCC 1A17872]|uniref:penicillin-binding protein 2 n=1 Tax=Celerinatantimonas sp. MCCC 1A17872 TaxID=3177514 RepID=UPI0038C792AA